MKLYLLSGIILLYLLVLVFFYFYQRTFLYFPELNNYLTKETINEENQQLTVKTSDDISLKSYYYSNKNNTHTILFLHGNAGTLENRIYKLNAIKRLGFNYLAISWRGFSGNQGEPSEFGLTQDAIAGLNFLNKSGIRDEDIYVYGESLGTGVAINLSISRNLKGLILESPYTSIAEVGKIKFPFLPVNLILKDKYDSISKIDKVNCPVLVLHGFSDTIVPFYMGEKIFNNIKSKKYSYFVEDNHMMDFSRGLIKSLQEFIQKH